MSALRPTTGTEVARALAQSAHAGAEVDADAHNALAAVVTLYARLLARAEQREAQLRGKLAEAEVRYAALQKERAVDDRKDQEGLASPQREGEKPVG